MALATIIEYGMSEQESKAMRVCIAWNELCRELFPGRRTIGLPKRGDPRKCSLFRYAWKMVRETSSYGLSEKEYPLYVRAQLEMNRAIKIDASGTHARIDPIILVGDKAWVRWKIYKKKYAIANEEAQHKTIETQSPHYKVVQELLRTLNFLMRTFGCIPRQEDIEGAVKNGQLKTWIMQQHVSPYYALMSPWCRSALGDSKIRDFLAGIDVDIYKKDITREVVSDFMVKFKHEFAVNKI